jgi:type II secretory pathway predicted ATPase ExeA
MYYRHFGLDGSPFQFTPSARLLYMSKSHREGLAALEWGLLHEPSGFTLLIGETGTGKTTLIVSILARNHERVRTAYINNPRLGFDGVLREVSRQYGVEAPPTRFEMLDAFDRFLARLGAGERAVIIVDEAQSLDDDTLEDLRLFSNRGSGEEKRLHFVLVGQPELMRRLMRPRLRQLNDRIGARAMLNPLTRDEAAAYVEYRLAAHGGSAKRVFEPAALDHIIAHSGGIPRRINVLGHNAMLLAYSARAPKVNLNVARTAVTEYENLFASERPFDGAPGAKTPRSRWRRLGWAAAGFAVLGVVAIAAAAIDLTPRTPPDSTADVGGAPPTRLKDTIAMESSAVSAPSAPAPALRPPPEAPAPGTSPAAAAQNDAAASKRDVAAHPRKIRVHYGDTLQRIAAEYLGSEDALGRLIDANPQLSNVNQIYPGQIVYLPDEGSRQQE